MNYKKLTSFTYATALTIAMGVSGSANALEGPNLQIDATGGDWINNDPNGGDPQTTFCSADVCDFYAIAHAGGTLTDAIITSTQFYVSIALSPQTGPADSNLGTMKINNVEYDVTADMTYGTPPLNDIDGGITDQGDLQSHSIFETFYTQIAINFVGSMKMNDYNVEDDVNDPENEINAAGASFYQKVTVDTTNLDSSVELHLDLYSALLEPCSQRDADKGKCVVGDLDRDLFAPFSHDGGTSSSTSSSTTSSGQSTTTSSGQSSTGTGVPEPSTLALLGFGLLSGLLFSRRRKVSA